MAVVVHASHAARCWACAGGVVGGGVHHGTWPARVAGAHPPGSLVCVRLKCVSSDVRAGVCVRATDESA
eukprot:7379434-Prymnesium_polylepis.1